MKGYANVSLMYVLYMKNLLDFYFAFTEDQEVSKALEIKLHVQPSSVFKSGNPIKRSSVTIPDSRSFDNTLYQLNVLIKNITFVQNLTVNTEQHRII